MSQDFIDRSLQLIMDVPARSTRERSAWICRNLAEFGLVLDILGYEVDALDSAVRDARLNDASTPKRFADRLRGIRQRRGNIPVFYPVGTSCQAEACKVSQQAEHAAVLLSSFVDCLRSASRDSYSGLKTHNCGELSIRKLNDWRPTAANANFKFIDMASMPDNLLWRGWFLTPQGILMAATSEKYETSYWDIRWGVHNGTHLDLLANTLEPAPASLEFGGGLLLAESIAMSAELLAGAEALIAGDVDVMAAVADGLEERVRRLCLCGKAGRSATYDRSVSYIDDEFSDLPTLAEAYVSGPLELIRDGYAIETLSPQVQNGFRNRWADAVCGHEAIAEFIDKIFN